MANKTRPTDVDVTAFLDGLDDPVKRADADRLVELMGEATGEPPRMWGPSIVGFGACHYRYASGREGDTALVGFSPRKAAHSIYLLTYGETREDLLARLGPHRMGKGCLYVKRLADVDESVLRDLIDGSVAAGRRIDAESRA